MTPLNFMDFRDFLSSASGFQSLQVILLSTLFETPISHPISLLVPSYGEQDWNAKSTPGALQPE